MITNKTLSSVVLNAELGSVGPRATVVLERTLDRIERSKSDLVRLANAGVIGWSTMATTDLGDDEAEGATVAYINDSVGLLTTQLVSVAGPTDISSAVVRADTSSLAPTLTLPSSPRVASEVVILDFAGNASVNAITINGSGAQLINGSGSLSITTNYGYRRVIYDGANWIIVGAA